MYEYLVSAWDATFPYLFFPLHKIELDRALREHPEFGPGVKSIIPGRAMLYVQTHTVEILMWLSQTYPCARRKSPDEKRDPVVLPKPTKPVEHKSSTSVSVSARVTHFTLHH